MSQYEKKRAGKWDSKSAIMSEGTIIALFVMTGLIIGWFMHGRTSRTLTSIMKRLAAEKNGVLE